MIYNLNYGGMPMLQHGGPKGEKGTTLIVSFIGDKADDITLFVAKAYSEDKQVLVIDLSMERKILVNAAGDDCDSTVDLRRICYTVEEEMYYLCGHEYDVVLLYSDGTREIPSLIHNSDYIYLCFGMQRYSMFLFEKMFSITDLGIPYALVFRGVEDKKRERMIEDFYHMLSVKRTKAERIYYIPICEKDISGLLQLEYNVMVLSDLSNEMQELVEEVTSITDSISLKTVSSKV
jgi:hypothetical protein